jgi:hypothetical protein
MKIRHLSAEEAVRSLHSGPDGLSAAEAARRLREFGPNRVEPVQVGPALARFLKGFTHFFALLLWAAAGLAFVAEWQDPGSGMAALGYAIVGVILVNGLFSAWQEHRAERAMAALQRLLPHQVKVLRDGKVRQAPAEELVPGDVLFLDGGDDVPADCRLLEAFGVRVNNATVTGESVPQAREARPAGEDELPHSRNVVLAGTSLVSGQARGPVFATGMHTEFGQIAHLTRDTGETVSPLQHEIIRLSRLVALLALALGLVFFLIGRLLGLTFWQNFLFAIGILVANVPEGLLPTVTLALAMASQRMAHKNALIRHLPSVETLGSATVICTDKTGTLTQNRMAVRRLFLSGQLYDPDEDGLAGLADAHRPFFEAALLCHTLKEVEEGGRPAVLGDPLEVALVAFARRCLDLPAPYPRVDEVPFDSERRRLSTLHRTPGGLVLYTKGALEALLPLCGQVRLAGGVEPLTPERRREFLSAQDALAAEGLRVLAVAYRPVVEGYDRDHLAEGLILAGLVGLEDPLRPEVPAAIARCHEAGIKVIMVTGDHPHTACAIARRIGLVRTDDPRVITGEELRRLGPAQLQRQGNAVGPGGVRAGPRLPDQARAGGDLLGPGLGRRGRFWERGPDRQHRAGGLAEDRLGHAAHQEPAQPPPAVRPQDDEVRAHLLRGAQDHRRRLPLPQQPLHPDAGVGGLQAVQLLLQPLPDQLGVRGNDVALAVEDRDRVHVQQDQAGRVVARQRTGHSEGVAGLGREIGRVQNGSDRHHGNLLRTNGPGVVGETGGVPSIRRASRVPAPQKAQTVPQRRQRGWFAGTCPRPTDESPRGTVYRCAIPPRGAGLSARLNLPPSPGGAASPGRVPRGQPARSAPGLPGAHWLPPGRRRASPSTPRRHVPKRSVQATTVKAWGPISSRVSSPNQRSLSAYSEWRGASRQPGRVRSGGRGKWGARSPAGSSLRQSTAARSRSWPSFQTSAATSSVAPATALTAKRPPSTWG